MTTPHPDSMNRRRTRPLYKDLSLQILVAMILSFLASFDEAQGTFLVGIPNYITMPTEMYTLVLNYPEQAAAVFSILLAIPSVVLMSFARKHVMGGKLAEGFQIR